MDRLLCITLSVFSFLSCNKDVFELPCEAAPSSIQEVRNILKGRWVCDSLIYDCEKEDITYSMELIFPDSNSADIIESDTLIWVYHTQINSQDTATGYGFLRMDDSGVFLDVLFKPAVEISNKGTTIDVCENELIWGYNGLKCNKRLGRHFYKVQ